MIKFLLVLSLVLSITIRSEEPVISDVQADYRTQFSPAKQKRISEVWRFTRSGRKVLHERSDRIDIWTRLGESEIALEQVHLAEKVIIEFTAGELKAQGRDLGWNSYAQMIDTNLLSKLKFKGTKKVRGEKALRYKGELDGAVWEVLWLSHRDVPALIKRTDSKGEMKTELVTVPGTDPTIAPALSEFRRIDYADLGDMESDPLVHRLTHSGVVRGHHHPH